MKRYQSVEFKKKYSIEILKTFFKEFPEEKRGRKRFKEKELQNRGWEKSWFSGMLEKN